MPPLPLVILRETVLTAMARHRNCGDQINLLTRMFKPNHNFFRDPDVIEEVRLATKMTLDHYINLGRGLESSEIVSFDRGSTLDMDTERLEHERTVMDGPDLTFDRIKDACREIALWKEHLHTSINSGPALSEVAQYFLSLSAPNSGPIQDPDDIQILAENMIGEDNKLYEGTFPDGSPTLRLTAQETAMLAQMTEELNDEENMLRDFHEDVEWPNTDGMSYSQNEIMTILLSQIDDPIRMMEILPHVIEIESLRAQIAMFKYGRWRRSILTEINTIRANRDAMLLSDHPYVVIADMILELIRNEDDDDELPDVYYHVFDILDNSQLPVPDFIPPPVSWTNVSHLRQSLEHAKQYLDKEQMGDMLLQMKYFIGRSLFD